jgi:hypothetical protein
MLSIGIDFQVIFCRCTLAIFIFSIIKMFFWDLFCQNVCLLWLFKIHCFRLINFRCLTDIYFWNPNWHIFFNKLEDFLIKCWDKLLSKIEKLIMYLKFLWKVSSKLLHSHSPAPIYKTCFEASIVLDFCGIPCQ